MTTERPSETIPALLVERRKEDADRRALELTANPAEQTLLRQRILAADIT